MDHYGNMLEEPFMWAIIYEEDVFRVVLRVRTQSTPPSRNDCSNTIDVTELHGLEDGFGEQTWIIHNDAAKADIHGCWAGLKKLLDLCWRLVVGLISEEESAYVYTISLKCMICTGYSHSPMLEGQSKGLGISAGDQQ
jgi:hypothetical protein